MAGFNVLVRSSPIKPPMLETDSASSVEIRDEEGKLQVLLVLIPGRPTMIMSSVDSDKDFESVCSNLGFQVYKSK